MLRYGRGVCAPVLLCIVSTLGPSAAVAWPNRIEWQRQTLEVRCGENVLAVALETKGLGPAKLVNAKVNGSPSQIRQQAAIEQYLGELGAGTKLAMGQCLSSETLSVFISGSRVAPPAGDEDDVTEVFVLSFDGP